MGTRRQITLAEIEERIAAFEQRYGVESADRFSIVPAGTDPCEHDDLVDWSQLVDVRDRARSRSMTS